MNLEEKVIDGDEIVRNVMYEAITRVFQSETDQKLIAQQIRERLEEKDPGKWNVILGKDFSSHVVHVSKRYGYWKLGELYILIWQS